MGMGLIQGTKNTYTGCNLAESGWVMHELHMYTVYCCYLTITKQACDLCILEPRSLIISVHVLI